MWCWIKLRQFYPDARKSMTLSCSMKMRREHLRRHRCPLQIAVRPAGLPPLQGGVRFCQFCPNVNGTPRVLGCSMTRSFISSGCSAQPPAECVPAGTTGSNRYLSCFAVLFCEEGYHSLTLEPHLAMFDFFAPGPKGGRAKLQFENNPMVVGR